MITSAIQIHNLFSLSLIGQDNRSETRLLLPDGQHPAVAYSPDDNAFLVVANDDADIWARRLGRRRAGHALPGVQRHDQHAGQPASRPELVYNPMSDRFLVVW